MSRALPPDKAPPTQPSLRLTDADFDAYLPERATSNAFTRPRLELKQRMLAWAPAVVVRLAELGVAVEVTGSDEHPNVRNARRVDCQRVFFWRDATARAELERLIDRKRTLAAALGDPAPHKNHAYLALKLDHTHVEVSVEVHVEAWVDVRNLRARLADTARAIELLGAFEVLPEQFSIGLGGGHDPRLEAQRATSDEIRALLDESDAKKLPLWVGWSVPRDVAAKHSEILDEQLEDAIVALGPVFKLIAWSPDNDLLVLDREWDTARAERARAHEEAERDKAEWEAKREGERQARAKGRDGERARPPRGAFVERPRDRDRAANPREDASAAPPEPPVLRPHAVPRRAQVASTLRGRAGSAPSVDPSAVIEKGTRVEVLSGPFEGKIGLVQELDGKGGARVMLGLLALRLEVSDLVASVDVRERPVLASSHRKPFPARS